MALLSRAVVDLAKLQLVDSPQLEQSRLGIIGWVFKDTTRLQERD
jgi:hypothetical protein